jgi:hypothetical protein
MLTSADNWRPENKWFRQAEDQIEVIRWIKAKLEQPGSLGHFL